jgi:hypothetical protein
MRPKPMMATSQVRMKISFPEGTSTFRRTAKGRESKLLSPASVGRSWLTFKDAQNENIRKRTGSVVPETKISMDFSSLSYNAFVLKHVLDVLVIHSRELTAMSSKQCPLCRKATEEPLPISNSGKV